MNLGALWSEGTLRLCKDKQMDPMMTGPVTYLCRSDCSFMPLGVRRPRGFCLPMLSADGAGYRSR